MFSFHTDKARYFEMQRSVAAQFVVPMLERHLARPKPWRVLEVGCAEAGVLKAFTDAGHYGLGIELEPGRAALAREFLSTEIDQGKAEIRTDNIYDVAPRALGAEGFDAIVLKDVIEHIPHQERMLPRLAEFLAPGGKIFFGFPPWMMPFGGHQQIARSKWVSKVPWLHLLPAPLYRGWVRLAGERGLIQDELEDIRSTRITIERFERISAASGFELCERTLWLTNPIYSLKFGIPVRKQIGILASIPVIRNFTSTAAYYVVGKAHGPAHRDIQLSSKQPKRAHATAD